MTMAAAITPAMPTASGQTTRGARASPPAPAPAGPAAPAARECTRPSPASFAGRPVVLEQGASADHAEAEDEQERERATEYVGPAPDALGRPGMRTRT